MFTYRRIGIGAGIVAAGLLLPILASCSKPQQPSTAVLPRQSGPVLHALYAQDIRTAMRELNDVASQQVWMQVYTGQSSVDMQNVAQLADNMAQVAQTRLPQTVANVQMDAKEHEIYLALCQRLHEQAVTLKQEAQGNRLAAAQASISQIHNTCNSCHTLFRDIAGPIGK